MRTTLKILWLCFVAHGEIFHADGNGRYDDYENDNYISVSDEDYSAVDKFIILARLGSLMLSFYLVDLNRPAFCATKTH